MAIVTAVAVAWFLAVIVANVALPYCWAPLEPEEAVCYFGATDYGQLYRGVVLGTYLYVAPIILALVAYWAYRAISNWSHRDAA